MKKFYFLILIFFFTGCSGYKPTFSSKDINFYINQIITSGDDKISYKIKKRLEPYTSKALDKKQINLKITSLKEVRIIAKDNKGDASMFDLIIVANIEVSLNDTAKNIYKFSEKFTFKNQTNKFELEQYKISLEDEIISKIFEKLILNLRTL